MGKLCKNKMFILCMLICIFALHSLGAAAISFQIIQHDSVVEEIRASSYVIEGTLFDYFFEHGYIATNAPISLSSGDAEDKTIYYQSLAEAKDGGCHYFAAFIADYDVSASANPNALLLSNIKSVRWELFDARTGAKLDSGIKAVGTVGSGADNKNGISQFMTVVAQEMMQALRKK